MLLIFLILPSHNGDENGKTKSMQSLSYDDNQIALSSLQKYQSFRELLWASFDI